ncbi:MAG: PhoH-like protein [Alphaproteobacteria bacterium MarineAlpha5_Bin11]|nr:phosphate starvation-inducible protein PhoH [Pelagibacteraceae bacterium]PPR45144.1 MAG: PhoH-like protein [Alphaproteobacteria bacterium MarineAlpha5_Bin11]PPR52116.1 MAG: PhoH-like protein [Alphaproteobacteria bacterium MarineAlpha5_Bin10]|tara:strand:+ start:8362 stop:9312 length:951 start_codon:yes stop_codon:yes gene_type:complete
MHTKNKQETINFEFDDNFALIDLFGSHNQNLILIEKMNDVLINHRGNKVNITGNKKSIENTHFILKKLYQNIKNGEEINEDRIKDFKSAISLSGKTDSQNEDTFIETKRKKIFARTVNQKKYLQALNEKEIIFSIGPAGTGKTYLAVAKAVSYLLQGKVNKIVLSRPAVEAGERLGFLPGDMREKVDPYLRPIYDALYEMLPNDFVDKKILSGVIEIAPIAFMRGRTLNDAFIILDEAQNTSTVQMKMFLTRLGKNSKMVVAGDVTQIDLGDNQQSGLVNSIKKLNYIKDIAFINLTSKDVVRHELVQKIIDAYNK